MNQENDALLRVSEVSSSVIDTTEKIEPFSDDELMLINMLERFLEGSLFTDC